MLYSFVTEYCHLAARKARRLEKSGGAISRPPMSVAPPIVSQEASSRSMSRPGSTTAPCGSDAIADSSIAVDGIEAVEPAAITGP
jgi:hypothetical protein